VDLVLHVGVSEVDLFLVVDLLVDHALLLATSAEDQTILPETARLRPWNATLAENLDISLVWLPFCFIRFFCWLGDQVIALLPMVVLLTLLARLATSVVKLATSLATALKRLPTVTWLVMLISVLLQ
jgi:hypothetical protein